MRRRVKTCAACKERLPPGTDTVQHEGRYYHRSCGVDELERAAAAERERDRGVHRGGGEEMPDTLKYVVEQGDNGLWFWHLVSTAADNFDVFEVCEEGYSDKDAALRGAAAAARANPDASDVVEVAEGF